MVMEPRPSLESTFRSRGSRGHLHRSGLAGNRCSHLQRVYIDRLGGDDSVIGGVGLSWSHAGTLLPGARPTACFSIDPFGGSGLVALGCSLSRDSTTSHSAVKYLEEFGGPGEIRTHDSSMPWNRSALGPAFSAAGRLSTINLIQGRLKNR